MIDNYPDTLALIAIHDGDAYEVPWGTARDAFYQAAWTPFACWDGQQDAWPVNSYEAKFISRQAVPTDVTIDMEVFGSGAMRDVLATVCIEPGGIGRTMMIYMAQVLDHYGPANFDRNMVQTGSSGAEITVAPGECRSVTESFALNSVSQGSPENLKFFAWAQNPLLIFDPQVQYINNQWYGAWFGEVYQGGKALPPFNGLLVDGFESGDTSKWGTVTP